MTFHRDSNVSNSFIIIFRHFNFSFSKTWFVRHTLHERSSVRRDSVKGKPTRRGPRIESRGPRKSDDGRSSHEIFTIALVESIFSIVNFYIENVRATSFSNFNHRVSRRSIFDSGEGSFSVGCFRFRFGYPLQSHPFRIFTLVTVAAIIAGRRRLYVDRMCFQ